MKKKRVLFHLTLLLLMVTISFSLPVTAQASQTAASSVAADGTAIDTPSSQLETVPADKVPTQQAPSSKGTEDTMAMLLKFVVLWSIIYIIIKVVRRKLDEQKKIK